MKNALNQSSPVEVELNNLALELLETFSELDTNAVEQLDTQQLLRNYILHVIRCGLAASRSGVMEMKDHCVRFQTILRTLMEQPPSVVVKYLQVLEQWPMLLMSHINSESGDTFARELDELIEHTSWPVMPDSYSQKSAPSVQVSATSEACSVTEAETLPEAADNSMCEMPADQAPLIAELNDAVCALKTLTQSEAMPDQLQVRSAMLDCANRLELFAISAAAADQFGLMDVAQLFQTALRRQINITHEYNKYCKAYFDLHAAMVDYLVSSSPATSIPVLTSRLRQVVDQTYLDDRELSSLAALLAETLPVYEEAVGDTCHEEYEQPIISDTIADSSPELEETVDATNQDGNGLSTLSDWIDETLPLVEEVVDATNLDDNGLYTLSDTLDDTLPVVEEVVVDTNLDDNELSSLHESLAESLVAVDETETIPTDTIHVEEQNDMPVLEVPANSRESAAQETPARLSPKSQELLQLIASEFEQVSAKLAEKLQLFSDDTYTAEQRNEVVEFYRDAFGRFIEVFESIGLVGLNRLFNEMSAALQNINTAEPMDFEYQFWLAELPGYVLNYLSDPVAHSDALIGHCLSQSAILNLEADAVQSFAEDLQHPQIDTGEEDTVPRQTIASEDDISLDLPDDVNPQLLESLLQELPNQTAEFSRVIANIVQGKGHLQDLETAQRVAHTLKGAANTVGVAGIANLTHHIEDILLAFTRQQVLPAPPLTITLQDASDVLEIMSENLLGIGSTPKQQALAVLQQILDWANQIDLNGLPEASQAASSESLVKEPETHTSAASTDTSLRISLQSVDDTLRLIGESTIVNAQLQEVLRRSVQHNRAVHAQSTQFQQLAFELEQLIEVRGMNSLLSGVTDSAFDSLEMDQYNELHTLTRRMVEAATDARALSQYTEDELKNLETLIHQQKRHVKDTQDVVMKTRMLPVQHIVPRLQRSARQACRLTGKEAELVISGTQTLIDNDILSDLADPIMHILRNAIDHGIEEPDFREQHGKQRTGNIKLDFAREGEYIVIRCQDDGAGLDFEAIKQAAQEKGVLQQDEIISTDALTRLIFVAGLTTREETTQVSGRGIGMDVVYNQVNRMKGSIRVASEPQSGVLIEIQLPATLVTLHGILVSVHDQVVAISSRGVEQILYADDGSVSENETTLEYNYLNEKYNAYFLEDLLGRARTAHNWGEIKRPAMLLNTGDGNKVAVLIDKILNTQDVVIKKLGPYIPPIPGVEGVTILGDGSVSTVVDLAVLVAGFEGADFMPQQEMIDPSGIDSGTPKVLVVDDSLSARKSLAEFMHDTGYRVATARDGIEAIAQLEKEAPDILLVDMEMPRMNGLELSSYVRANKATQNLPIIMITSRATDKHREEAEKAGVNAYLIKPYTESQVLDQISAQLARTFANSRTN